MTLDPNKPVRTRDGCAAHILCTDLKKDMYTIAAAVAGSVAGPYHTREKADAVASPTRTAVLELIFDSGKLVDFKRWETNDE